MHILFGSEQVDQVRQEGNYTFLELDSIQPTPDAQPQTAWCILADVPLPEINQLQAKVKMHHDMLQFYRTQQWSECQQLLELLIGSWNGEVDSFYQEITKRIALYQKNPPGEDWDAVYRPWEWSASSMPS